MITITEYANRNNVSYESVRQQIKRYESELKGHIRQDGRVKVLDEEAVRVLDSHRQSNVVVYESSKMAEKLASIDDLKQENMDLKDELTGMQRKLLEAQDQIIRLLSENKALLMSGQNKLALQESYNNLQEEFLANKNLLQQADAELHDERMRAEKAEASYASACTELEQLQKKLAQAQSNELEIRRRADVAMQETARMKNETETARKKAAVAEILAEQERKNAADTKQRLECIRDERDILQKKYDLALADTDELKNKCDDQLKQAEAKLAEANAAAAAAQKTAAELREKTESIRESGFFGRLRWLFSGD